MLTHAAVLQLRSPVAHLLTPSHRQQTASELNSAILAAQVRNR